MEPGSLLEKEAEKTGKESDYEEEMEQEEIEKRKKVWNQMEDLDTVEDK